MSRDIKGKVGPIEGSYSHVYSGPLILQPCEHHIEVEKKGVFKKETWVRTFHGESDGKNSVEWHCKSEKVQTT